VNLKKKYELNNKADIIDRFSHEYLKEKISACTLKNNSYYLSQGPTINGCQF